MTDVLVAVVSGGTEAAKSLRPMFTSVGPLLGPADLDRRPDVFRADREVLVAALACNPLTLLHGASVCTGALSDPDAAWWKPGTEAPEGSYALFRIGADTVECLTDFAASRSIWYYADADVFLASTSQRAIVALLGSFELNEAVVTWMLSAGNIGPHGAWDRRLRLVPPDARLVLDRRSFRVSLCSSDPASPAKSARRPPGKDLFAELVHILRDMKLNRAQWALALSGGVDSRALLAALPGRGWTTVSWGTTASLTDPGSDLAVAQALAKRACSRHRRCSLDIADDVAALFDKFVRYSEGRSDHLAGYVDSFRMWHELVAAGVDGVIRGDELMGSNPTVTDVQCWYNMGLATFDSYAASAVTRSLVRAYPQTRPESLNRRPGESTVAWRHRLRAAHELPVVMAALNHVRSRYVEMANPLLARRLVAAARQWPDDLLDGRVLFKSMVNTLYPDMPFARTSSVMSRSAMHAHAGMRAFLMESACSQGYRELLPADVHRRMMKSLARSDRAPRTLAELLGKARRSVSWRERQFRLRGAVPVLDVKDLALRTLIAGRAPRVFAADARSGAEARAYHQCAGLRAASGPRPGQDVLGLG